MRRFLAENWVWIVAPIVLMIVIIAALAILTPEAGQAPFRYALF